MARHAVNSRPKCWLSKLFINWNTKRTQPMRNLYFMKISILMPVPKIELSNNGSRDSVHCTGETRQHNRPHHLNIWGMMEQPLRKDKTLPIRNWIHSSSGATRVLCFEFLPSITNKMGTDCIMARNNLFFSKRCIRGQIETRLSSFEPTLARITLLSTLECRQTTVWHHYNSNHKNG